VPLSSLARCHLPLWIFQLLLAVPSHSRATFVELLCACLVSPEDWVTRAISAICRRKHWTTYYKLIERGSIRIVPLARATFSLVLAVLAPDAIILVIDDTLVPRGSLSAPGCDIRFDHARQINRPEYMRTQNWVTLGIRIFTTEGLRWVLPVLSRLVPAAGNRNQLTIALALIRALAPVADIPIRVLFDSWFMRARLVLPLLHRGFQIVGQARYNTALFLLPPPRSGRGRPRKYGQKLTRTEIEAPPAIILTLNLYGTQQTVRIRSVVALARFLRGTPVRAVWCEFFDPKDQTWSKPRLLLASETELSAEAVLRLYARRWGISNLWQQSRKAVECWMQIRSTAWTLAQLLVVVATDSFPIRDVAPWRTHHPLTAGLIAQWLRIEFTGLPFRDGYDPKSRKFQFPEQRYDPRLAPTPAISHPPVP